MAGRRAGGARPGSTGASIRLGLPGVMRGVVVDTSFFKGNFPEQFSLEACDLGSRAVHGEEPVQVSETSWTEILPKSALKGDTQNCFSVGNAGRFTHLRLSIYPDGGVARLRVHGEVLPDNELALAKREIDLAAIENGGRVRRFQRPVFQRAAEPC